MSNLSVLTDTREGSSRSVHQGEPNIEDDMTRDRRIKLVMQFHKLNPPTYAGIEGSEAAEEFLNRTEKIFDLLGCTSQEKVELATYSLQCEADAWWKTSQEMVELEYEGDAYERFRQAYLDKYFPFTVREDKVREFDLLVQTEDMTVDQYDTRFSKLSRYAPEMVNTPAKRARKFERGLLPRIQSQVAALMLTNYRDLYRCAQKIEKTLQECGECEALKEKRLWSAGTSREAAQRFVSGAKRRRFVCRGGSSFGTSLYSGHTRGAAVMSVPPRPPTYVMSRQWHLGWQCPTRNARPIICYQCGQPGHVWWSCPQNQRSVATGVSNAPRGRAKGGASSSRGSVVHARTQACKRGYGGGGLAVEEDDYR